MLTELVQPLLYSAEFYAPKLVSKKVLNLEKKYLKR